MGASQQLLMAGGATSVVPDPYFANVVQLAHFNGANGSTTFTNSASVGPTMTPNGSGALSTTESKWGGASLRSVNTGCGYASGSTYLEMGTGDYTIEWWQRLDSVTSSWNCVFWGNGSTTGVYVTNSGIPHLYITGTDRVVGGSNVLLATTWQFIAYSRTSGTGEFYVDGTRIGSWSDSTNLGATAALYLGRNSAGSGMSGYIDDFRMTKGVGRYSGATCPVPTAAFPDS